MIYSNKGGKKGTKRAHRASLYGNPITKGTKPSYTPPAPKPALKPISDEVTVYGAKKFRTPYTKDEFVGKKGSPIPAYVFDIDGTLSTYGSMADKAALEWAAKLYKADPTAVFLIITARDHGSFGYESSFNWLMHSFPYPFIGPFARAKDDPRYASEFKRELAQGFEDIGLYKIMGAADDNEFVIKMWKQWAKDHFDDPKDFDLLECSYGTYGNWRSGLPSKGTPSYGTHSYAPRNFDKEHWDKDQQKYVDNVRWEKGKRQEWVKGSYDKVTSKWVEGHWEDKPYGSAATNRPAGTHKPFSWDTDPADGKWKRVEDFITDPTPEMMGRSLADDPAWQTYFNARKQTGAYTDEPQWSKQLEPAPYSLQRLDLIEIVRKEYPGYTEDELNDMSDEELRENAGIVNQSWSQQARAAYGSRYVDPDQPIFSADQLGLDGGEPVEERQERITRRLDMEDDVYAEYRNMTIEKIQEMDYHDLALLLEMAAVLTDEERDECDTVDDALRLVEMYGDDPHAPKTQPLDVAEVLSEMNENDLSPDEAQARQLIEEVDAIVAGFNAS